MKPVVIVHAFVSIMANNRLLFFVIAGACCLSCATCSGGTQSSSVCEQLGTDLFLNSMFQSNGSECNGEPSFHCSGIFMHGRNAALGAPGAPGSPAYGKFQPMIPPGNLSTDIPPGIVGSACPIFDIKDVLEIEKESEENVPIPFWCPTSYYRQSFTYVRQDFLSVPWANADNGILFTYQPVQNLPEDDTQGGPGFWEDRLAVAFPSDASTFARTLCGVAPKIDFLASGLDADVSVTTEQLSMNYPSYLGGCQYVRNLTQLQEYADSVLPGLRATCPESITSGASYLERLQNITRNYFDILWGTDEKAMGIKNQSIAFLSIMSKNPYTGPNETTLGSVLPCYFNNPNAYNGGVGCFGQNNQGNPNPLGHDMQCALEEDRFDSVFIDTLRNLSRFTFVDNMYGNEVVLNPFGGIPYSEVFKYMALYVTTVNSAEDRENTLLGAEFIYNTTGIQVPVVLFNMTMAGGIYGNTPFSCL